MQVIQFPYSCNEFFKDADYLSHDNYIVINDRDEVFWNGSLLKIKGECSFDFPKVKIIPGNKFLLVDSERSLGKTKNKGNAWIINNYGEIEKTFYLGGVQNLLVTSTRILASYSECELDTSRIFHENTPQKSFSSQSLVAFNNSGEILFEYYRDTKDDDLIFFMENYAFLYKDEESVYFMPYLFSSNPQLPIVELDVNDYSTQIIFYLSEVEGLLDDLSLPIAFSKKGKDWFFITPDRKKMSHSTVYKISETRVVEIVGECAMSFQSKGLPGGKFLLPTTYEKGKPAKCQLLEL
ncbi:MAG: hypothetical protein AAF587_34075 [Bacteroidota bacterium]